MLKLIVLVIVILVLGVGGFFLYQNFQIAKVSQPTSTPQIATTPQPTIGQTSSPVTTADPCEVLTKGSADVPPLYAGIQWQQPKITEYEIPLGEKGSQMKPGCLLKSLNNTDDTSLKSTSYYDDNLQRSGWETLVTASGVYSSIDSYHKLNKYFVVKRYSESSSAQKVNSSIVVEVFYAQ